MKIFLVFLFVAFLTACHAQDTDVALRVAKPKTQYALLPELEGVRRNVTYDLFIPGLKATQVSKVSASFGTASYRAAANGKDTELKITATDLSMRSGIVTVFDTKGAVLLSHDYKVIATVRLTDISPSMPGSGVRPVAVLLLNKDTLADNGKVTLVQIKQASTLTLIDSKLKDFIRKNLMCRIRLVHDTATTTLHSSLDRLSDKVKLGLAKAQPGDKIVIENIENLWIDAKRQDYITGYGSLTYELTVTE